MPSRRRFLAALPVAAALAGCAGETGPGTGTRTGTGSPTSTPGGDGAPRPVEPEHPAVDWRVDLPHAVQGLDVADGRVAVTAGRNAYESGGTPTGGESPDPAGGVGLLRDGDVDWYLETTPPASGAPVVRDGVLAVVGYGNGFHGIEQRLARAVDGELRWESERVDDYLSLLAADGDRAYVATSDDALGTEGERLFAVGDGGETAWSVESGDAFRGRLHDGRLFVDVGGRAIAAHDPATGDREWRRAAEPVRDASGRSAVVGDLVFGEAAEKTEHGYPLVALSLDGGRRWTYSRPAGTNFVPTGVAATAEGPVGTEYGGLVFGLASDGDERWTATVEGQARSPPVAAGGTVYVGDNAGTVTALDGATGDETWRRSAGTSASVVTTTGDAVVVAGLLARQTETGDGARRGYVVSLDPADGSERWRFETSEDLLRPVVAEGTVYLGSESGAVRVLPV